MVGIVLVSHSESVAQSVEGLTKMMAPQAMTAAAGGLEDGGFGTSFERVKAAVEKVYSPEGVVILVDMGSAVMTTEMVVEAIGKDNVKIADAPFLEGALAATVSAQIGSGIEEILETIQVYENKL